MPKRLTQAQLLGQQGVNLVEERVLSMGYVWHPTNQAVEVGIDGYIELRDPQSGVMSGSMLFVQSKARTSLENETAQAFDFACTRDDLEYWLGGTAPVLLIVSKPRERQAWWVSIKEYFCCNREQSRRIRFDKHTMRFDDSAATALLGLAMKAGSAAYFRPPPRQETIVSNLLPVIRLPVKLFQAETSFRERDEVRDELKKRVEWPQREYVLGDGLIFCVHDLQSEPWPAVCDASTVEHIPIETWSNSTDSETRRRFVQLLNLCLGSRVAPMGMHYSPDAEALYFKASSDLKPRRKSYHSRKVKASRQVFGAYYAKTDPTRVSYFRHVGFERHFRRYGGTWFLEINPTYHYTIDGKATHPFCEELLSKIKTIEGNKAVAGLVIMFGALLQDEPSLFHQNYPHLGFGSLVTSQISIGLDDAEWLKRDELQPPPSKEESAEMPLFENAS